MPRGSVSRRLALALQEARRRNLAAAGEPPPVPRSAVGYTRRHLIRAAAALAGGAAIGAAAPARAKADPRIVIVGGGVAGLNAAYQLKKRGLIATVYEARDRLGGRMYSLTGAVEPGLVDDIGGSLVNTDHPDMLALIKDFGLKLFDRKADARRLGLPEVAYFLEGRLVPEPELADALRPLAAAVTRDSDLVDKDYDRYGVRFDRMTAAEYFDREAKTPLVRSLVEQTIRTEYGVEPGQSSALQFLFLLPTVRGKRVDILAYSDEEFVVEGGSGRVIDGLAAALRGQTVTGAPLRRLAADGDGYRLQLGDREVGADYVVLALPFMTLRDVDVQAPLPPLLRQCIRQLDLGRDEKLFAGFSRKPWHRPDGFAMDFWTDAGFAEAWDDTQREPGPRPRRPQLLPRRRPGRPPVRRECQGRRPPLPRHPRPRLPGRRGRRTGRFLRTTWSRQRYTRGGYTSFAPGQYTRFAPFRWVESPHESERQEVRVGNLVFAGEHTSDEWYGFMQGGAQTGRLAAESILRSLGA